MSFWFEMLRGGWSYLSAAMGEVSLCGLGNIESVDSGQVTQLFALHRRCKSKINGAQVPHKKYRLRRESIMGPRLFLKSMNTSSCFFRCQTRQGAASSDRRKRAAGYAPWAAITTCLSLEIRRLATCKPVSMSFYASFLLEHRTLNVIFLTAAFKVSRLPPMGGVNVEHNVGL
jgi:hypothetical protein